MNNIAYFINDKTINKTIINCINSLRKFSNCRILFYERDLKFKHKLNHEIEYFKINLDKWQNRRMTYKIENCLNLPIEKNDNVMVFDCDLIFNNDPFSVFNNNFDFFYTTRHYECICKVNGGVWGFRNNDNSKNLINFLISQANNPSWKPYLNIRKKFKRADKKNLDWWSDQDLLCAIHEEKPPIQVNIYDAGHRYNYCPISGHGLTLTKENLKFFLNNMKNDENIIIHLKEIKNLSKLI